MNTRIYFLGGDISRKEKKTIKGKVRDALSEIYQKKRTIEDLIKIPIDENESTTSRQTFAIYAELDIQREKIEELFTKKISKRSNYFLGVIASIKNVLYLIDVDELFFMSGEYYIWPSNIKKNTYVKIN